MPVRPPTVNRYRKPIAYHIGVDSTIGIGTTFTVHLPAAELDFGGDEVLAIGEGPIRGTGRVLVMASVMSCPLNGVLAYCLT